MIKTTAAAAAAAAAATGATERNVTVRFDKQ